MDACDTTPPLQLQLRRYISVMSLPLPFSVPRCHLNTFGRRACLVAGPTSWNSLPDRLLDPTPSYDSFRKPLKTELFASY